MPAKSTEFVRFLGKNPKVIVALAVRAFSLDGAAKRRNLCSSRGREPAVSGRTDVSRGAATQRKTGFHTAPGSSGWFGLPGFWCRRLRGSIFL